MEQAMEHVLNRLGASLHRQTRLAANSFKEAAGKGEPFGKERLGAAELLGSRNCKKNDVYQRIKSFFCIATTTYLAGCGQYVQRPEDTQTVSEVLDASPDEVRFHGVRLLVGERRRGLLQTGMGPIANESGEISREVLLFPDGFFDEALEDAYGLYVVLKDGCEARRLDGWHRFGSLVEAADDTVSDPVEFIDSPLTGRVFGYLNFHFFGHPLVVQTSDWPAGSVHARAGRIRVHSQTEIARCASLSVHTNITEAQMRNLPSVYQEVLSVLNIASPEEE